MKASNVDQLLGFLLFYYWGPTFIPSIQSSFVVSRPSSSKLVKNYAGTYENMGREVMMINIFMQVIGS